MLNKIPLQFIVLLSAVVLLFGFTNEKHNKIVSSSFLHSEELKDTMTVKNMGGGDHNWEQSIYENYQSLNDTTLDFNAFYYGLKGFYRLKEQEDFYNDSILTIVDFTQHSSQKRMYIIDVRNFEVKLKTLCAHGKNTGGAMARKFSNISGSLQSSLGFFRTAETYRGKFDYALRLDGLEESNSKARARGIVIHGADYATEDFIQRNNGVLGRSFGCPALPKESASTIIDIIKNGSCFFIYSDNLNYLGSSELINNEDSLNG